jgi:hypothetical protein
MLKFPSLAIVILAVGSSGSGLTLSAAQAQETVQNVLAAQIRTQGFACDKALGAKRDVRRSKPDHEVWVLKCNNAAYRVSRYPDMAAQVQQLR